MKASYRKGLLREKQIHEYTNLYNTNRPICIFPVNTVYLLTRFTRWYAASRKEIPKRSRNNDLRLAAGQTGNQKRTTFRRSSVCIDKGEKFFWYPFLFKSWSFSWSAIYDKKAFVQYCDLPGTNFLNGEKFWGLDQSTTGWNLQDDMRHQEKKFKRDLEIHCDYLKLVAGVSIDRDEKFFWHPFLFQNWWFLCYSSCLGSAQIYRKQLGRLKW